MKVGVCLPYMKPGLDRAALLGFARAIEAGPFDAISCGERVVGPTVSLGATLAAAAAVTSRVRIVPTLYVLPMHDAVAVAHEIATLDAIAGPGRVEVCVGVGGRAADYRAVGASFEKRHQRQDEQVARMRAIWRGEPPFEGADPVGLRPSRAGGPPLLAGVMGPRAFARAAHWADGVYVWSGNGEKHEIAQFLQRADEAWSAAKRTAAPRKIGGFWYSLASGDAQAKLSSYVFEYTRVFGDAAGRAMANMVTRATPDALREALANLEAAGCEECFLVPATAELAEVERAAEIVSRR
ncbi:MAG TPA: LLM class flavin-dependent oxidoreductase [Myxococcota bacterium]|jgi:alkanesulfonate monooxygenase SsuD/methylene tetrahydromethanopterin reductase-like flavin-dependent oxidoreductase (luciferase family)